MSYFTRLLTSKAYTLRLPEGVKDEVERYVLQHQRGSISPERAPFRRQLDFWVFSIVTALASGLPPRGGPSSSWGRKFADTRSVEMADSLCDLLATVALAEFGPDYAGVDDPAEVIELGNGLAGAGCPKVLEQLNDPSLRVTALDKALELAAALRSDVRST